MFVVFTPEGRWVRTPEALIDAVAPVDGVSPASAVAADEAGALAQSALSSSARRAMLKQRGLQAYRRTQRSLEESSARAAQAMSPVLCSLAPVQMLEEAWRCMQAKQAAVALVQAAQKPVGLLVERDLIGHVWRTAHGVRVRTCPVVEAMRREVVTCHAETPLRQVAVAMAKLNLPAMPVLSAREAVIGMVTPQSLIQRLAQSPSLNLYV